ncbi:hypothetical protein L195_g059683, partial [Trifolium pratense]
MGLLAIRIADVLSQKTLQEGTAISKALKSCFSHNNSEVTAANALYSASADDLDTVTCFFDLQDTKDSPMKMQNPVVDFLVE